MNWSTMYYLCQFFADFFVASIADEPFSCMHLQAGNSRAQDRVQGLFVSFARVGSGDPVRVLRRLHNEYTGCS